MEELEENKAFAEKDREALKSFVPDHEGIIITLGGKPFVDAKEAGKAIIEAIKSGHGEDLLGSYKGLRFSLRSGFEWKMELKGRLIYSEKVHMGDYAANIERLKDLEKRLMQYPERIEAAIQDERRRVEETRNLLAQTFPQEEAYQQKLLRLQELDVLLSEETAKNNDMLNDEIQKRHDALKILAEDGDYLEAAYAEMALDKLAEGAEWSEEADREIARELFAQGFERKEIAPMLMKRSPKIYDAETAEAIVSSEKKCQRKAACR